ncbi:putative integral membrane protein [Rosellinia necatrix]|uniref:Putative integral membrane protein n=1 Tax=Rosellinia necatrix TaxID=77044 RepID=A0A1W2TRL0_ROSNE|nr:putative integral membrane protein [Rosellinia necatrix]
MAPKFHEGEADLIASYIVLDLLAIFAVALRFYAARLVGRETRSHDYFCVLSLVALLGYTTCTLIGTIDGGIGLHISEVSPAQLTIALKSFFASQFFWAISIASFRLAILLLYIEIFSVSKFFQWAVWASVAVVCAFFVGSIITTLTICRPIALNWDKTITNGTCGDIGVAELVAAAFNTVLDVVIVALPLPVIWRLQLPTHKKVAITVTFGLGLGISAINLVRVYKVISCNLTDFTYCTLDSAILTVAEMGVGITVACVPSLAPLIRRPSDKTQRRRKQLFAAGHSRLFGFKSLSDSTSTIKDGPTADEANFGYDHTRFDHRASAHHLSVESRGAYASRGHEWPAGGIGVERDFVVTTTENH